MSRNSNHDDDDDDDDGNRQRGGGARVVSASHKAQALSMSFMKAISGICCDECGNDPLVMVGTMNQYPKDEDKDDVQNQHAPSELYNLQIFHHQSSTVSNNSSISPLVLAPMTNSSSSSIPYYHPDDQQPQQQQPDNHHILPPNSNRNGSTSNHGISNGSTNSITVEGLLGEYMCLCRFYQVPYNAGIITTLRYSLPSLRVSGAFHDLDMLALVAPFSAAQFAGGVVMPNLVEPVDSLARLRAYRAAIRTACGGHTIQRAIVAGDQRSAGLRAKCCGEVLHHRVLTGARELEDDAEVRSAAKHGGAIEISI